MQTKSEILALIKSIATRGKKLDSDIQSAAIHAVYYSVCHGDVTIGQKLLEAFSSGLRKAALVGFLEEFGQFEFKKKELVYRKNDKLSNLLENALESESYCDNIQVHWTAFKPEKIASKHDLLVDLRTMVTRMDREIKAGMATNTDVYDYVSAALAQYEEDKAEVEEEDIDAEVEEEDIDAEIKEHMEAMGLTGTHG